MPWPHSFTDSASVKPHHLLFESKEFIKHRCMIQDVHESSFLRFIILFFSMIIYHFPWAHVLTSVAQSVPCAHFCPSVCITGTLFLHIWILLIKRESDWSAPLSRVMCQPLVRLLKRCPFPHIQVTGVLPCGSGWGGGLGSSPAGKWVIQDLLTLLVYLPVSFFLHVNGEKYALQLYFELNKASQTKGLALCGENWRAISG